MWLKYFFCKAREHSSCTEEPMCPPNSNRIESCSEALENCIELSVCEQTIYCDQHEPFCDAPYYCDNNEREVESCEGLRIVATPMMAVLAQCIVNS